MANMETWSAPMDPQYRIQIFLDTNILNFLVDETFPLLNRWISSFQSLELSELVCSEYVMMEFINIRRREHFLRLVLEAASISGTKVNLSSIIKHKTGDGFYSIEKYNFEDFSEDIGHKIAEDIIRIESDFLINIESESFHSGQINPCKDILTKTRIESQDAFVVVSSVFPDISTVRNGICFLTKDRDLVRILRSESINDTFAELPCQPPKAYHLSEIKVGSVDLATHEGDSITESQVAGSVLNWSIEQIQEMNQDRFLGNTHAIKSDKFPENCIAFKYLGAGTIHHGMYITVLSKDLKFIFNSEAFVNEFWNNGVILDNEAAVAKGTLISFKFFTSAMDDERREVVTLLRDPGNLVFYHFDK